MTSQTSHFEFEAAILNLEPAVIQLIMTTSKIYQFVLRNILSQNMHKIVTDWLLLTNEEEKLKKIEKRQKIDKIHS